MAPLTANGVQSGYDALVTNGTFGGNQHSANVFPRFAAEAALGASSLTDLTLILPWCHRPRISEPGVTYPQSCPARREKKHCLVLFCDAHVGCDLVVTDARGFASVILLSSETATSRMRVPTGCLSAPRALAEAEMRGR